MKSNSKYIAGIIILVLLVGGFIGYKVIGKSTQDILQSKTWTFNSSKGDGLAQTAKFSDKSLTLSEVGLNVTYSYEIQKKSGNEVIKFTNKDGNSGKTETRTFKISKDRDEYKLKPINTLAKDDTGDVTLIPK